MANKLVYLGLLLFIVVTVIVSLTYKPPPPRPSICSTPPDFGGFPSDRSNAPVVQVLDIDSQPQLKDFQAILQSSLTAGVNFAGLYVLTPIPCGVACYKHVIINTQTGKIVFYGLSSTTPVQFQPTSSLIKVIPLNTSLNSTRFYNFSNESLQLICQIN